MDGIIDSSDVVLIDRGDLSREIPLESMVTNRNPTIAESNDVANTLLDGVHGLVLAAETAIGHDPVGIVNMVTGWCRRSNGRTSEPWKGTCRQSPHPETGSCVRAWAGARAPGG